MPNYRHNKSVKSFEDAPNFDTPAAAREFSKTAKPGTRIRFQGQPAMIEHDQPGRPRRQGAPKPIRFQGKGS